MIWQVETDTKKNSAREVAEEIDRGRLGWGDRGEN